MAGCGTKPLMDEATTPTTNPVPRSGDVVSGVFEKFHSNGAMLFRLTGGFRAGIPANRLPDWLDRRNPSNPLLGDSITYTATVKKVKPLSAKVYITLEHKTLHPSFEARVAQLHHIGQKQHGTVRAVCETGVLIGLDSGFMALAAWPAVATKATLRSGREVARNVGDRLEVIVQEISLLRKRIRASVVL